MGRLFKLAASTDGSVERWNAEGPASEGASAADGDCHFAQLSHVAAFGAHAGCDFVFSGGEHGGSGVVLPAGGEASLGAGEGRLDVRAGKA